VRTALHLRFPGIRRVLLKHFSRIADHRDTEKVSHQLQDVCMSVLAMFCFQDPSLLEFQKRTRAPTLGANLRNLWGIESIPSDWQMRTVMDEIDAHEFEGLFTTFFRLLQRGKYLEQYRVFNRYYLCVMEGSEYFSSDHNRCSLIVPSSAPDGKGAPFMRFSPMCSGILPLNPRGDSAM
jgi:hypothetical protein